MLDNINQTHLVQAIGKYNKKELKVVAQAKAAPLVKIENLELNASL